VPAMNLPLTDRSGDPYIAAGLWENAPLYEEVERCGDPERIAAGDQHEQLTYRDLLHRTNGIARLLLELGIGAGDVLAVQTPNRVFLPAAHLACNRIGALFMPISDSWRHREVQHLLTVSRARYIVVPPTGPGFDFLGMLQDIRGQLPDLEGIGITEGKGRGDFSFSDLPPGTDRIALSHDPNLPSLAMVASGTTELPKVSIWTDNNLRALLRPYRDRVKLEPGDVAVGIAPANTGSTGYIFPVVAPLMTGATSILLEHWNPAEALDLLEKEEATLATAIPTQLIKMLQIEGLRTRSFDRLTRINNAGAPLSAEHAQEIEESFGCRVQTAYGATDGGAPVMTALDDPPEKRYSTVGRAMPATELRLVDPQLGDVAPGEQGEILWRNGTKTYGYFNDPDRTAETFVDGFYRSGDLGFIDPDGYLKIVGRVKDMIIRGGQNVAPIEIESLLLTHPDIREVAVIGLPDAIYGERVCACVVAAPGADLELAGIGEFLRARQLAVFKLPERLELFADFPQSAGAKVSKAALRGLVLARAGSNESVR
jgi:non-ribosomal peptide synthetase component E (peptide arylation enzyme)